MQESWGGRPVGGFPDGQRIQSSLQREGQTSASQRISPQGIGPDSIRRGAQIDAWQTVRLSGTPPIRREPRWESRQGPSQEKNVQNGTFSLNWLMRLI